MAWTSPMTAVANATFTAAQFNTHVRDNLNETAAAKATTSGRIFVATGANALAERIVGRGTVSTSETTTSTSFTDLATSGPSTGPTTGTTVIIILSARLANSSGGGISEMGVEISGATTQAASADLSVRHESSNANDEIQCSYVFSNTVTAGVNTFTAKYQVSAGTGTFSRRRLFVLPFG